MRRPARLLMVLAATIAAFATALASQVGVASASVPLNLRSGATQVAVAPAVAPTSTDIGTWEVESNCSGDPCFATVTISKGGQEAEDPACSPDSYCVSTLSGGLYFYGEAVSISPGSSGSWTYNCNGCRGKEKIQVTFEGNKFTGTAESINEQGVGGGGTARYNGELISGTTNTTVSVGLKPDKITADGKATTTATATVTEEGKPLTGQDVSFSSSDDDQKVGSVSEDGAGTYTATLTASETAGEATIMATDESDSEHPSDEATLTQVAPTVDVSVDPVKITADGKATATVKATVSGVEDEPIAGEDVSLSTTDSGQKIGAVSESSDGTYTATLTASHKVGDSTITATDDSDPEHVSADATLTQVVPTLGVSLSPTSITADGKSTATVKVTVKGVEGEPVSGEDIAVTTKGPVAEGLLKDEGDGSYTETLTALRSVGKVEVTATDLSVDPNVSAMANLTSKAPKPKKKKPKKKPKPKPKKKKPKKKPKPKPKKKKPKPKPKKKPKKKKPKLKECKVPRLAGDTLAQAKKALGKANCDVGKVSTKKSGKVAKGKVISTSPKAGGKHKHGTRIGVVLSSG